MLVDRHPLNNNYDGLGLGDLRLFKDVFIPPTRCSTHVRLCDELLLR